MHPRKDITTTTAFSIFKENLANNLAKFLTGGISLAWTAGERSGIGIVHKVIGLGYEATSIEGVKSVTNR